MKYQNCHRLRRIEDASRLVKKALLMIDVKLSLAFLLCLVVTPAYSAGLDFDNGVFRLSLKGEWTQQDTGEKNQFVFVSDIKNSQVTISYDAYEIPSERLEEVANKLLQLRFEAEQEVAADRKVTFSKPWGSQVPDGLQINYIGRDNLNRFFFYTGFVLTDRILNVYGEIADSSKEEIDKFYVEVLSNFGY